MSARAGSGPTRRGAAARWGPLVAAQAYRAGWWGVRRLPERAAARLFQLGADVAARRGGKGVDRLRANYSRVTGLPPGELDDLVRAGLRTYARYWCEVFRLPSTARQRVAGAVSAPDQERIWAAHREGRGVILVLGHLANWDVAATWLISRGHRFTTVAERLRPEALFDAFVAFRESIGMEVVALTGGEQTPSALLEQRLRAGGVLCLLADRDLSASGVPVTFFGATATMPAGPAALALRTGAALLPTLLANTDDPAGRLRLWDSTCDVRPAIPHTDVATMTQEWATALESAVRERPQDWHMLARLWRDDLTSVRTP